MTECEDNFSQFQTAHSCKPFQTCLFLSVVWKMFEWSTWGRGWRYLEHMHFTEKLNFQHGPLKYENTWTWEKERERERERDYWMLQHYNCQKWHTALLKVTYGHESPGWISLFKPATYFFFKYPETSFFLVKLIGQWIPVGAGKGVDRDIKKIYFLFQNSTKKFTKVATINKAMTLLFKLS